MSEFHSKNVIKAVPEFDLPSGVGGDAETVTIETHSKREECTVIRFGTTSFTVVTRELELAVRNILNAQEG